jgi:hypothetical protein
MAKDHLEWLKVTILAQKCPGNKMFGKDYKNVQEFGVELNFDDSPLRYFKHSQMSVYDIHDFHIAA